MAWGVKSLKRAQSKPLNVYLQWWVLDYLRSPEVYNISQLIEDSILKVTGWEKEDPNWFAPDFPKYAVTLNAFQEAKGFTCIRMQGWIVDRIKTDEIKKDIGISTFVELCILAAHKDWEYPE